MKLFYAIYTNLKRKNTETIAIFIKKIYNELRVCVRRDFMKILKKVMLILCVSFIIPLVAMVIHLTIYEYNNAYLMHKNDMIGAIERTNISIDNHIDIVINKLIMQCEKASIKTFLLDTYNEKLRDDLKYELYEMCQYSDFISGIAILDENGRVVIENNAQDISYLIDYAVIDTVEKDMEIQICANFLQVNDSVAFLAYAPIMQHGDIIGYMVQVINADYWRKLVDVEYGDTNSNMFFIDNYGHLLGYENQKYLLSLTRFKNSNGLKNNFGKVTNWSKSEVATLNYKNLSNKDMIAFLKRSNKLDVCMIIERPKSVINRSVQIIIIVMLTYSILLAVTCLIAYTYIKRILKAPISEIVKTTAIYEDGDFSYRPKITGDDEFNNIAVSLWKMAERIKEMYELVKANEHRYQLSLEFSSDLITDYDLSNNIYTADTEKWNKIFDFPLIDNEKQIHDQITKRLHPKDERAFKEYRDLLFKSIYDDDEKQLQIEFRMKLSDNEYHWMLKRDVLVKGQTGNIDRILGSFEIIDEQKKKELELKTKAEYDLLSKLFNRATFMSKVNNILEADNSYYGAMIFIDADNFKFINDTYGHNAGDDVIRYIASTMRDVVAEIGFCGRYGGDEFIIYVHEKENAIKIARGILADISRPFAIHNFENSFITINVSIGIAYYPEHANDGEELLRCSDDAMYVSKKSGKNQYTIFNSSMKQK